MNLNEISVPCVKCDKKYNGEFFLNLCKQNHNAFIRNNGFYTLIFSCSECQNQINTTFDSDFSQRIRDAISDAVRNTAHDSSDNEMSISENENQKQESNDSPEATLSADGLFLISPANESCEDSFIEDEPDFSDFENEQFDQDMDEDELYDGYFDVVELSPPVNTEPTYVSEELNPPLQLVEIKTKFFLEEAKLFKGV